MNYRTRFQDLSKEQALARLLRAMDLESKREFTERIGEAALKNGFRHATPLLDDIQVINMKIYSLLGNEAGYTTQLSGAQEISDTIKAISSETGMDFSWLEKHIGRFNLRTFQDLPEGIPRNQLGMVSDLVTLIGANKDCPVEVLDQAVRAYSGNS